jgi:hypothetical protein
MCSLTFAFDDWFSIKLFVYRQIQITLTRTTAFPAPEKKKRATNAFSHQ